MTETTQPESLRILLVEDNAADARIIQETLREMPFPTQLEMVEDGEAALAFLRRIRSHPIVPRPHSLSWYYQEVPARGVSDVIRAVPESSERSKSYL